MPTRRREQRTVNNQKETEKIRKKCIPSVTHKEIKGSEALEAKNNIPGVTHEETNERKEGEETRVRRTEERVKATRACKPYTAKGAKFARDECKIFARQRTGVI